MIRDLAIRKDAPWHDGPLEVLAGQARPACAQQRLVGEWSVESDPVEVRDGFVVLAGFEEYRAQHQIRFVPDREFGGIIRGPLSGPVQLL